MNSRTAAADGALAGVTGVFKISEMILRLLPLGSSSMDTQYGEMGAVVEKVVWEVSVKVGDSALRLLL